MTAEAVLLELTGVSKRFGRITVADSLSLRFTPGETVGIVGPNGAGKSTLFAMIAGDLNPDAGDVRVDGRSVLRLDPATRCRMGIARTYQVPRPFENMTVFENLLVAAYRGGRLSRIQGYTVAARILEETGLSQEANRPAGRLGLLQRKRLELARGLATQPRILLLDEVAGGLTDPEVAQLVQIVEDVRQRGVAIVWVEHVVHALTRAVSRIIGANGAGKSTRLRSIIGLHQPTTGAIVLEGRDITALPPHARVREGIALVPEGRRLFPSLSVEENLLVGQSSGRAGSWSVRAVYGLFDWMGDRRHEPTVRLSGGEQQAVAIGRALMANPQVLLLDELSLGLAPTMVRRIYGVLPELVKKGMAILLVEQDVAQALRIADRFQCLLEGRTTLEGKPAEATTAKIEAAYFGLAGRTGPGSAA